jgi:hypothetical protein
MAKLLEKLATGVVNNSEITTLDKIVLDLLKESDEELENIKQSLIATGDIPSDKELTGHEDKIIDHALSRYDKKASKAMGRNVPSTWNIRGDEAGKDNLEIRKRKLFRALQERRGLIGQSFAVAIAENVQKAQKALERAANQTIQNKSEIDIALPMQMDVLKDLLKKKRTEVLAILDLPESGGSAFVIKYSTKGPHTHEKLVAALDQLENDTLHLNNQRIVEARDLTVHRFNTNVNTKLLAVLATLTNEITPIAKQSVDKLSFMTDAERTALESVLMLSWMERQRTILSQNDSAAAAK